MIGRACGMTRRQISVALFGLAVAFPAILILVVDTRPSREVHYGSLPAGDIHFRTFALAFVPAVAGLLACAAIIAVRRPPRSGARYFFAVAAGLALAVGVLLAVFLTLLHKTYFPPDS